MQVVKETERKKEKLKQSHVMLIKPEAREYTFQNQDIWRSVSL